MITLTYNLQKDIDSGAILIYSPNDMNDKFDSYAQVEATAKLHGFNVLEACNSLMIMYGLNYCKIGRDRAWCNDVVDKWNAYYMVLKSKKKYKCKECGWKGKIIEMGEGIMSEYGCPNCDEDFDISG